MKEYEHLRGLDGWLILVGLGLLLAPIRMLISVVPFYSSYLQEGVWAELMDPASEFYIRYFGPLLISEMAINFLLLTASIYLIILFFSKHHTFPKVYIFLLVLPLIYLPLNAWIASTLLSVKPIFDEWVVRDIVVSFISCCIWIPYLLLSKRVRVTFVEGKAKPAEQQPG